MQERRTTPRIRTYRPVRVQGQTTPRVLETLTKDIALGGLRCLSPTVFPVSAPLQLEVTLGAGEEPLTVRGRAAWFRTLPDGDQYDLGVVFVDLSEQDKLRLSAYLSRLSQQAVAPAPSQPSLL